MSKFIVSLIGTGTKDDPLRPDTSEIIIPAGSTIRILNIDEDNMTCTIEIITPQ